MRMRPLAGMLATLAAAAVLTGGTTAIAKTLSRAAGTASEQTHPAVIPRSGHPRTRFTIRLTLADAPGHAGVLDRYASTDRSAGRRRPKLPGAPLANIDSGLANQVVRIMLKAPALGWCTGRYTVTVFLQRGPYCPPPARGQPPTACPEFATQELDVGRASFSVTRRR